jgi:uncharacterized membrane protein
MNKKTGIQVAIFVALGVAAPALSTSGYVASITPIGVPYQEPKAVSRDGSVVAGTPGFSWTAGNGVRTLPAPPTYGEPAASCLAFDGSIIVGAVRSSTYGAMSTRWDVTGTLTGDPNWRGSAAGCSHDAQVVVGYSVGGPYGTGPTTAVRWTATDGVQILPTPAGTTDSEALGVSGNGAVTVGWFIRTGQDWRAARWLGSGELVELWMPPGFLQSQATAVSDDGNVIVGYAWRSGYTDGVRWSLDGTGEWISPGFIPRGVNRDGSVMVGTVYNGNGGIATRWTRASGAHGLLEYLRSKGADTTGWSSLWYAVDVSADGKVIVGSGTYNGQERRGFVAFAPLECPGDLFVDGKVDGADLGVLLSQWGPVSQATVSDINGDGVVNGADLGMLLANWGACP